MAGEKNVTWQQVVMLFSGISLFFGVVFFLASISNGRQSTLAACAAISLGSGILFFFAARSQWGRSTRESRDASALKGAFKLGSRAPDLIQFNVLVKKAFIVQVNRDFDPPLEPSATLGEVSERIAARLRELPNHFTPSHLADIREALSSAQVTGPLTLLTSLTRLVPAERQKGVWDHLGNSLYHELAFPKLEISKSASYFIAAVSVAGGVAAMIVLGILLDSRAKLPQLWIPGLGTVARFLFSLLFGVIVAILAVALRSAVAPFSKAIPQSCDTLAQLASALAGMCPSAAPFNAGEWTAPVVMSELASMIHDRFNVPSHYLTESTRLEDLGPRFRE